MDVLWFSEPLKQPQYPQPATVAQKIANQVRCLLSFYKVSRQLLETANWFYYPKFILVGFIIYNLFDRQVQSCKIDSNSIFSIFISFFGTDDSSNIRHPGFWESMHGECYY